MSFIHHSTEQDCAVKWRINVKHFNTKMKWFRTQKVSAAWTESSRFAGFPWLEEGTVMVVSVVGEDEVKGQETTWLFFGLQQISQSKILQVIKAISHPATFYFCSVYKSSILDYDVSGHDGSKHGLVNRILNGAGWRTGADLWKRDLWGNPVERFMLTWPEPPC